MASDLEATSQVSEVAAEDCAQRRLAQTWLDRVTSELVLSVAAPAPLTAPASPLAPRDAGKVVVRICGVPHCDAITAQRRTRLSGAVGAGFAGVVETVTTEVKGFRPGDRVFGILSLRPPKANGDCLVLQSNELVKMPAGMDFQLAASLPAVCLTAWQMLFSSGRLDTGEVVLVLGAETPVGAMALQLATLYGLRTLAATQTIEAKRLVPTSTQRVFTVGSARLEVECANAAVVLDTLGGSTQRRAISAMESGAMIVSCVQHPNAALATRPRVDARFLVGGYSPKQLARIAELIEQGHLALLGPLALDSMSRTPAVDATPTSASPDMSAAARVPHRERSFTSEASSSLGAVG